MIEVLKMNPQKAANKMKKQVYQGRSDNEYENGNWVWLKHQTYKQKSIKGQQQKFDSKCTW